jgi:hypothetical protein
MKNQRAASAAGSSPLPAGSVGSAPVSASLSRLISRGPEQMRLIDISGQSFGQLQVLRLSDRKKGTTPLWECRCSCGQPVFSEGAALRSNRRVSCRYCRAARVSQRHTKHGKTKTAEAAVWRTMKQRCLNPNNQKYPDYGGRGIYVCQRWIDSFEYFLADMGTRPSIEHTIERKDNDGPYSPENCRWAPAFEQASNTRRNVFVDDSGERVTLTEWARRHRVHVMTAWHRLQKGVLKSHPGSAETPP